METPRHALLFILATILLDAIGVGLIFPLMPDLMQRVGAADAASGALLGGILMAAYAAMQFLFAPLIGGLSDALGRKPVLLIALATLAVDYVIMALAQGFWLLLVGRVLAGIAGATYITATAYLADISPPEKRAANFGLIGATYGIGFVMGPALGGLLAAWHLTAPFWVAACFAAANVALGLLVLPESLPPQRRRRFTRADLNPFGAIGAAFRLPGLALPLMVLFTFEFANMVYPTLWAFWSRETFGWSAAVIGTSFAVYGIGVAVTQGAVLPVLIPRIGEFRTLIFGAIAAIAALIGLGVAPFAWVVFALIPLACLSDMVPPTATAMMSNQVPEDRQGLLQGVIASLGSIAAVVAPLLVTPLFHAFAAEDARLYMPGAPFIASGLLLILVFPAFLALNPQRKRAAP
ncbi:MFS transporter [Sinisalibacter aestuarii]|uniref:Tetracycline resistance MFS efflux pump n=1 Tax=Sinisalibacter aestuarii TaxID=2949426 RepID=A0ABQ5LPR0_9RHOB|nr:MFS transporter [Sinisalibacter aestuarii]GKY86984.1 tetracycline resistance MFS efflux pump [Sinisalibacter aestuarii]